MDTAPKPRRRRLSKGMYILPSLFTTGNMAAGFWAILQVMQATATDYRRLDYAAEAIGFAVLFDGLDGRIAPWPGTGSVFGKDPASPADVTPSGGPPAILPSPWGFHLM